MMKDSMLPKIYFGGVDEPKVNWREIDDDFDPDDEESAVTDSDIVLLLGFDPKEFSREEKQVGIGSLMKGGAGSGNYDGPGQPRFAREESPAENNREYSLDKFGFIEYRDPDLKRRIERLESVIDDYVSVANRTTMAALVDAFDSTTGRKYNEIQLDIIRSHHPDKFNSNGDLKIYRGGKVNAGYNSFSIDREQAQGYSRWGYGSEAARTSGSRGTLIETAISPSKITAVLGDEIIVHSSKLDKKKQVGILNVLKNK